MFRLRGINPGRDGVWLVCIIILSLYTLHIQRSSSSIPSITSSVPSSPVGDKVDNTPHWTLKDRLENSEKIYRRMLDDRRSLIGDKLDELSMFPATDAEHYHYTPYSIWDMVPAAFNCPWDMQRVGRMGDGGKWVCGMTKLELPQELPQDRCVVYSFGVRDESTFEEEMLRRTDCGVWAYDPAVSSFGPQMSSEYVDEGRAHFLQAALGPKTEFKENMQYYSLKKLMAMNGHVFIDILKMDIEFAEFDAMTSFLQDTVRTQLPIGQLLVEVHMFEEFINPKKFLKWWEALEARGLRPVWTEPNLIWVTQHLGDSMPRLAEYTLLNINSSTNKLLRDDLW